MGTPGTFDYYRCANCGLVQITPVPSDIGSLYEAYPIHQRRSRVYLLMRKWLMSKGYFLHPPPVPGARVLDCGCGDGWYLQQMASLGWEVVGFEFDPEYAEHLSAALNVEVFSDPVRLVDAYPGAFDLVTMNSVLEHVSDLPESLAKVRTWLKPGGQLYLSVPNIESKEAVLFGRKWHGLDPPRHLSFPGDAIVEGVGAAQGLEVVERGRRGMPNLPAGSLATALAGRYSHALFLALILPSALYTFLVRENTSTYLLRAG